MVREKKKATITDIATAAGVSKATVSRYINGKEHLISDKAKERIKTVIELLDYRPDQAARSLKTKRSRQIGVLLSNIETPFAASVIVGVSTFLHARGYEPLFVDCHNDARKEAEAIHSFLDKMVEGLIVNTTFIDNPPLIRASCEGCPVVLIDRFVNNHNFNIVTVEQRQTTYRLVEHLKQVGYTRPVVFALPVEKNTTRLRKLDAFIQAVNEIYGYDPSEDVYIIRDSEGNTAEEQLEKLMASAKPEDKIAIMGINSETTVLTYKAIIARNLSMPDQIGLCGPEEWVMNWSTLLKPAITTVCVPTKDLGFQAAQLLLELIDAPNAEPRTIELPCKLIARESTGLKQ